MCHHKVSQQGGFTLLEVLVAMVVFTMLSLGAYQIFANVQLSNQISQQKLHRIEVLQRAMVVIDQDFRQMSARYHRQDGEEPSDKVLVTGEYYLDSLDQGIMFIRGGWRNPQKMFNRSEVTRVGYRLTEKGLERLRWRYPDTVSGAEPSEQLMIPDVDKLSFRFFVEGQWQDKWDQAAALPQGIEVQLTLSDYGEISRIYLLPEANLPTLSSDGEDND
ncbi:type II secretion system minor pseudopilin GspJ [Vibrio sp. SS-MA-C1-2]|nr:type II secretion system minor pseudopilin GspJ [Vibrio sp. SS-MA-C1-2]UJF20090.1 type II secretion system minor pseudopilin GspJ [Vibrio sp. SS-MA-C1-2]